MLLIIVRRDSRCQRCAIHGCSTGRSVVVISCRLSFGSIPSDCSRNPESTVMMDNLCFRRPAFLQEITSLFCILLPTLRWIFRSREWSLFLANSSRNHTVRITEISCTHTHSLNSTRRLSAGVQLLQTHNCHDYSSQHEVAAAAVDLLCLAENADAAMLIYVILA